MLTIYSSRAHVTRRHIILFRARSNEQIYTLYITTRMCVYLYHRWSVSLLAPKNGFGRTGGIEKAINYVCEMCVLYSPPAVCPRLFPPGSTRTYTQRPSHTREQSSYRRTAAKLMRRRRETTMNDISEFVGRRKIKIKKNNDDDIL